ncbi:hypothetical protein [Kitasatospora sp. NPDC059571]|uniref:hypothetical protein n=1 Tax=Kitasatospora sp. NPDC059571 TaxID=3346871 RepID=UPI0036CD47EA
MYRFIDAEKATGDNPDGNPITMLCRVLALPRCRLAARPTAAAREKQEEDLVTEIREIHTASRGAYGDLRSTQPCAAAAARSAGGQWRRPCAGAASRASPAAENAR